MIKKVLTSIEIYTIIQLSVYKTILKHKKGRFIEWQDF